MNLGVLSYSLAVSSSLVLTLLLVTAWRGRLLGSLLLAAVVITTLWAISAVWMTGFGSTTASLVMQLLEILRYAAWYSLLFSLLSHFDAIRQRLRHVVPLVLLIPLLLLPVLFFAGRIPGLPLGWDGDIRMFGHVVMAIAGLVLIEQIFRNVHQEQLWRVKHLLIGVGAAFAYDFIFYSSTLLFHTVDNEIWVARGFVNALVIPLMAVSVARNPEWSGEVFVSRKAVFHTTVLLATGFYLFIAVLAGYLIRDSGGSWGQAFQIAFLFLSLVLLVLLILSWQARAWLKVFLGKNFFKYQYDYRDEWLKLIHTMALDRSGLGLRSRAIKALADIVDSAGGMLWTRIEAGRLHHNASWNLAQQVTESVAADSSLARFLEQEREVIDLSEYVNDPDAYPGLVLPPWLREVELAWLVVPLIIDEKLTGFVLLVRPQVPRQINWEERDLLKTAGMQIASYVAFLDTSEALMDARQFEAFNRVSSYVVHDLKNVSAQLSLVVTNAQRHKDNPAFIEDAIDTVANATSKMDRVLAQLRKRSGDETLKSIVKVCDVLQEVAAIRAGGRPAPQLKECDPGLLLTNREQLVNILSHLVSNAQEATDDDGEVLLRARSSDEEIIIEIEDNGCGMDERFIRERLFRPFDTTKGNAGMGIGVYESREFVWSQGGEMTVQSRTGRGSGTVFRIRLPGYRETTPLGHEERMPEAVRG